ncbi:MAG TPA: hypothetical protein G4N92_03545 [Anaerolineae bacterium]|nr:hypothetical protein [Anaerolineae bacterium]
MRLTPPTKVVFWLATILAAVGILLETNIVIIPALSGFSFWLVAIGFVLLWLGNTMKGF